MIRTEFLTAAARCETSGKITFKLKRRAKLMARRLGKIHGKRLRAYRCPDCRMFHLTTVRV